MRYSNRLDDDFGDYILRKQEYDFARAEFEKTNKTGSIFKDAGRIIEWQKQNPAPKNPHAQPTWEELSSKDKWISVIGGLITLALLGLLLSAIFSK